MRKTDKKIDNNIIKALSDACEIAIDEFFGFKWLTHLVDYSAFPKSLKIICVFDTDNNLNNFMANDGRYKFGALIQPKLSAINVDIDGGRISYDTEEACNRDSNGKWADRLAKRCA